MNRRRFNNHNLYHRNDFYLEAVLYNDLIQKESMTTEDLRYLGVLSALSR